MKILTIGIPTYKRPKQIQRTVRALLPQLTDEVTLIVKDNCSPVPVETLFTEEEKKLFTIKRNKVNIGGDANIAGVLYDCETKWCWTLGDDDIPADNAVSTILSYIHNNPDVAFLKFDSPFSRRTCGLIEVAKLCKLRKLYSVYSRMLFMSSSIYNIDMMRDSLFYYYRYATTMNGQNVFLLKFLENNDKAECIFTNKHIVLQDDGEIVNPWNHEDFIVSSCPLLFHAFREKRKEFDSTLFVGLTFEYFHSIRFARMKLSRRFYLFIYVIYNYGIWNTIRHHSKILFLYFVSLFVPNSIMEKLKSKRQKSFNKSNSSEEI